MFNSPNTVYLTGHTLGEFIQDYCAAKHIYCDVAIMNLAFGCGVEHSENSAIELIETTAATWRLHDVDFAEHLETMQ